MSEQEVPSFSEARKAFGAVRAPSKPPRLDEPPRTSSGLTGIKARAALIHQIDNENEVVPSSPVVTGKQLSSQSLIQPVSKPVSSVKAIPSANPIITDKPAPFKSTDLSPMEQVSHSNEKPVSVVKPVLSVKPNVNINPVPSSDSQKPIPPKPTVSPKPSIVKNIPLNRDTVFQKEEKPMSAAAAIHSVNHSATVTDLKSQRLKTDKPHAMGDNDSTPQMNGKGPQPIGSSTPTASLITGYVGFDTLPNQIFRKVTRSGFKFNVMVVGQSGLGKTTFLNSLFAGEIYGEDKRARLHQFHKTVVIEPHTVHLKEGKVTLELTLIDTPGYADSLDNLGWNADCWKNIIEYVDEQLENFLNSEAQVNRDEICDNRVHSCLYFISPNSHCLRPLDVECMKQLHKKVNIIPLIAKADTLTPEECANLKQRISNDLKKHSIDVYEFPELYEDEDDKLTNESYMKSSVKDMQKFKKRVPFAVCGSLDLTKRGEKPKRVRRYKWGTVEIDNLEHCDFLCVRAMLLSYHMQDLKDRTINKLYESYRKQKLSKATGDSRKNASFDSKNPIGILEEERKNHDLKFKKMEQDMQRLFDKKVQEKLKHIQDSENELKAKHEQIKKNLDEQTKDLEEKRRQFEKEKAAFEADRKSTMDDLKSNDQKKKDKKKGIF